MTAQEKLRAEVTAVRANEVVVAARALQIAWAKTFKQGRSKPLTALGRALDDYYKTENAHHS